MQSETQELASDLLTPDAVSRLLGCSVQTLAAWRSTGRINLPYVKISKLVRYRRSDVDEFLRARTTAPGRGATEAGQ